MGGGGVVGENLLPSNPPTRSCPSLPLHIKLLISFSVSLSLSFSPWAAGRSLVPAPPLSCPSACWRRDASELSTTEERLGGGGELGGGKQKIESKGRR